MNQVMQTTAPRQPEPDGSAFPQSGLSILAAPPAAGPTRPQHGMEGWDAEQPPLADTVRVLLVEDYPADARLVSVALHENPDQQFLITHSATLRDALAVLGHAAIDVVLLDLSLPDSEGVATVTRLRDAAPQVPVVVMTGNSDPAFARRALEAGAQDYLVKGDDSGPVVARTIRYAIMRMSAQIDREDLIRKLESEQQALRRELDAARAMQFNLLPRPDRSNPRLRALGLAVEACFEPSSGIGGDLWGMADCGDSRMAFFSFDFSGHGISAALNVFRLHTLMREHAPVADDPAATLAELNQSLKGLLAPGQYATMFLGMLDTARDELVWSAAGHPEPALLAPDGSISLLDTRGTPLGAVSGATYSNRRIAFPRGTSLFVYSDAMTEAIGQDGHMLGEETLMILLNSAAARPGGLRLAQLLEEFFALTRRPIEDDLTAVHIRRR